jgi:hypothetical protein
MTTLNTMTFLRYLSKKKFLRRITKSKVIVLLECFLKLNVGRPGKLDFNSFLTMFKNENKKDILMYFEKFSLGKPYVSLTITCS